MANGYIGKISAVVTANTSDLSRKLQGAVKDVDRFAQTLNRSVSASAQQATASLEKIFTPLQRLERKLQTALQLNLRTDDEVRKIQQLVSVAEGINKPLERAAGSFSKLSLEVQGAFLPALNRAQDAAVNLSNTLQQQGSVSANSFKQVEQVVNRTTQAIQRLTQAQQLASQSLTGNELQFGNPRLFETLTANAQATRRAAALPAAALEDGSIARQIRALQQYQNAAVEAAARVESLRLEPNVNPEVVLAAERRLIGLIETARRAGREVETSVANAQGLFTVTNARPESAGLGLFGTQAGTAEQRALARARELSAEFAKLPESAQQGLSGLAGIAANLANRVDQGKASAEQLEAVLERLRTRVEEASPAAALARANARLAIAPDQPPPPPPRTDLGNRLQQAGADRIRRLTGDINIDSSLALGPSGVEASGQAQRDIDALASRVGQVRQQLETLPNSVRTQFIPALQRAAAQLTALQNSPSATAEQIERAAGAVKRLEDGAKRAAAALAIPSSREFLGDLDTRRVTGELQALQGVLAQVGAQAGGRAAKAYDQLAAATRRAVASGTAGLPRVQEELRRLQVLAARAAAETGKISFGAALRQIRRGGDVATGAFSSAALAVNQLVFAVDDFFSVTGNLEQRIRAVGNNITQFGVIVGQTRGLLIALAGVLAAQGFAALIRFRNGGAEAQDQTKSLNEALARQKNLVEDLARAFESLSDALTRDLFSEAGQQARELSRAIDEIRRKQQELRDGRVVDLDPDVRRERAIQGSLQRRLESETDIGRRISLQGLIDESRRREQGAADAARDRPPPTARDVEAGLRRTVFVDGARGQSPANRRDLARIQQQVADAQGDPRQLIDLLSRARQEQGEIALQNAFNQVRAEPARRNVEVLTRLIEGLERQIAEGVDDQAARLFESIDRPARGIRQAQEQIAEALEAGVPGAAALAAAVDSAAAGLEAAEQSIVDRLKSGQPVDQALVEAATKQRDAANRAFEAEREKVAAIDIARQALDRFADALNRASEEAQRNLSSAQSAADDARAADLGRSTPQSQSQRQQAEADLRRQQELASEVEQEIAAARERFNGEAARQAAIPQDIERRRREAQAVAGEQSAVARSQLERAQRQIQANENSSRAAQRLVNAEFERFGRGASPEEIAADPVLSELFSDFEAALRESRAAGIDPRRDIDEQIEQAQQSANAAAADLDLIANGLQATLQGLDAELQQAGSELVDSIRRIAEIDRLLSTQGVLGEGKREELVRERARLEQQAVEQDAAVQAARDESTREERRRQQAVRGRELSLTPAERAAESLAGDLDAVRQFFGRQAEEGTGLVDFEAQNAALQRVTQEALRSAAPAIFGLADQVANAVLQGPSRAALEAADVSSVEGARELNRLLRGDDAARNQDLVELQKQSRSLEELVELARQQGVAGVAD